MEKPKQPKPQANLSQPQPARPNDSLVLKSLKKYAKAKLQGDQIKIDVPEEIFGMEFAEFIGKEDIMDLTNQEQIEAFTVLTYIR